MKPPVKVVVAGVHGYGRHHLENVRRLAATGRTELVGVCDTRPLDGMGDLPWSADLPSLIELTGAEIAVIATPIHTHADLAIAAMRAGAHVLLEKPPAPSVSEFERITAAVAETGLACQVGFQSLGSSAIPALRELMGSGIRGIGVAGAWERPLTYYTRAAWAGRRRMDGIDVMDGALTNPFAHAVATALAVAGADTIDSVHDIELELYRANDIESDDTSSARIHLVDGTVIAVTVSLCADRRHEPYLLVHGEKGPARLFYTVDEIEVDGMRTGHSRTDLLDNLVGHVLDDEELLVPLERTGAFTRFVDAVRLASPPQAIPEELQRVEPERRVLPGIAGLAVRSAERLALLSELGFPRARAAADWPETTLHAGDREVATYVQRGDLQATAAPRPYLHPVRTLAGTVVTETQPDDHVHHLGAGVAISDLDGVNFWGGSTYVPGQGPTILPNHGRQRRRLLRPVSGGFVEELDWVGPDGIVRVSEERTIATRLVEGAWALDFGFTLTNRTSAPLSVQSSACKGRVGAGYGGFFWRAPKNSAELAVFTAEAEGEQAAHGSRSRWLALVSDTWSLLFIQNDTIDPWFVRVAEYPGIGPALAWDAPLPLDRELFRSITVVVADGRLTPAQASHLAIGGSS